MITLDHSQELVRVNFVNADKQKATIAVFNSFDELFNSKEALFVHTVDIETRESENMQFHESLSKEVQAKLSSCFNASYVLTDCIYELSIAYRDSIKLERHNDYDQACFYHEFLLNDLEEKYFQ